MKSIKVGKRYLLIVASIIALIPVACETVGEQVQRENPDMYKDVIGIWYIWSDDSVNNVNKISFLSDGTIYGNFLKYDSWSPVVPGNQGKVQRGVIQLFFSDGRIAKDGLDGRLYYTLATENDKRINTLKIDNQSYHYVRDSDVLNKVQAQREQNKIAEEKVLLEAGLKAISKSDYRSGKFGGGLRDLKWGMSTSDAEEFFEKEGYNGSEVFERRTADNKHEDAKCIYYKDLFLSSIEMTSNILDNDSLVKLFIAKLGKPVISENEEKTRYEYHTDYTHTTFYTWSDGITEIQVRAYKYKEDHYSRMSDYSDSNGVRIIYSSLIIRELEKRNLEKLKNDKENTLKSKMIY